MRFQTVVRQNGQTRTILVMPNGSRVDLHQADPRLPQRLLDLIEDYDRLGPRIAEARLRTFGVIPAEEIVTLRPPIKHPGKILCIGFNYRSHVTEASPDKIPVLPDIFAKFSTTLVGDGASIIMPTVSDQLDYEAELCVVIGKRCRNVHEHEALNYVFGYTILNDVSVRDWQRRSSQATMGKNFDTHGPCGPLVVSADEIANPQSLGIRLEVNGEVRQNGNTSDMIFSVAQLIAFISQAITLEPGDMISTGTPSGTAVGMHPPRWLSVGDEIKVHIEGIGTLMNTVTASCGPSGQC